MRSHLDMRVKPHTHATLQHAALKSSPPKMVQAASKAEYLNMIERKTGFLPGLK